ncbi:MAG: sulfate adenylyltransferase subunit CysD [Flavobacteriales bacterium]|nr:sulfate adenylyltransferase subunit CysD [Flavobacteriales bacterium]
MSTNNINHLKELEAEAIFVIREVAAECQKPVLMFSGGKDSIIMTHLAMKAFYPAKIPFPLLHVDTGHNFDETIRFRDAMIKEIGANLIIGSVQKSIDEGKVAEETGINASRITLQTTTLLEALDEHRFDAALGGARRDEEKARAKERFFSHRDDFGQWDPKNQRPELWNIFNTKKNMGEHFRVFPISNWTELDVWQYIQMEDIKLPNLYFSHQREVFERDGMLLAKSEHIQLRDSEVVKEMTVRFRTIGDITSTGAVESEAATLEDIIQEVASTRTTERGGRADDKRSETSMEDRKKKGYF